MKGLSYGSFYSNFSQEIFDKIKFLNGHTINGLYHDDNSSEIKLLNGGVYLIHCLIKSESQPLIGIYLNDSLIEQTKSTINIGTNTILIHEIILIKPLDILSIRNINFNKIIIENLKLTITNIGNLQNDSKSTSVETDTTNESSYISGTESGTESENESDSDSDSVSPTENEK